MQGERAGQTVRAPGPHPKARLFRAKGLSWAPIVVSRKPPLMPLEGRSDVPGRFFAGGGVTCVWRFFEKTALTGDIYYRLDAGQTEPIHTGAESVGDLGATGHAQWMASRDARAFADIVARHSAMVYSVCFRILRNQSDAEDVTQVTFLEFSRHDKAVRSVGALLHTIATRRALDRSRGDKRRRQHEARFAREADTFSDAHWDDIQGYIDEAVAQLPDETREVVVLRFYEGETLRELAQRLSLSLSTVHYREKKGIEEIRLCLKRRGVAVRATALAATLGTNVVDAAPALPPALTAALGRIALAGSPPLVTTGSTVSATIGGVLVMKKAVVGVGVCVALVFALWGGVTAVRHYEAQDVGGEDLARVDSIAEGGVPSELEMPSVLDVEGKDAANPDAANPDAAAALLGGDSTARTEFAQKAKVSGEKPVSEVEEAAATGEIHGHVLDAETGAGVVGVVVRAENEVGDYASGPSDETGAFVIANVPPGAYEVEDEGAEGYRSDYFVPDIRQATVYANEIVDGLVFELTKGVTVSGRVVDERGNGVAEVNILIGGGNDIFFNRRGKTDSGGAYVFTGLTPSKDVWLHATLEGLAHRMEGPVTIPDEGIENLTLTMTREAVVSGILVDGKGVPIPEYQISLLPDFKTRMSGCRAITDWTGKFRVAAVFEGTFEIMVNPGGKGSVHPNRRIVDTIEVRAGAQINGLRVVYDVATDLTISGRVTDTFGTPMAGERVDYIPIEAMSVTMNVLTDTDGYYRIEGLSDGLYTIDVRRRRNNFGHMLAHREAVPAGTENLDFVVTRFATVRGRVVQSDGQTPVVSFEISKASGDIDRVAQALSQPRYKRKIHDPEGLFELDMIGPGLLTVVVQAEGYLGAAETVEVIEGEAIEDLLVRLEPGGSLRGRVVNEAGQAVADAVIYLGTLSYREYSPKKPIAHSKEEGTFEIASPVAGELVLAAVHPDYAYAVQSVAVPYSGTVQVVLPWGGHITGTVWLNGEPTSWGGRISVSTEEGHTDSRLRGPLERDGRFSVGPMPTGEMLLRITANAGDRQGLRKEQSVYVESGKTTEVDIEFFLGQASVVGEIYSHYTEWRGGNIRLLPQDEVEGSLYSKSIRTGSSIFEIVYVSPGLYTVEAEARLVGSNEILLRHVGEVLVPEDGEVRHDILLIREE